MPSCLLANSFGTEEYDGPTSSDSDGEILKQFEISVTRSQTSRTQASERPRSVQAHGIDPEHEAVGSEPSDHEGGPGKQTRF